MHDSLVTIGITCFNAKDTISRAIDSALGQTWPNVEILITDDCSTDGSLDILWDYEEQKTTIRILTNDQNKGVSFNRQKILREAKGEYLCYFDDDDWSFPDRIERQMERLKSYAAYTGHSNIFCYGDRFIIKNGQKLMHPGIGREEKEPQGLIVADMILGNKKAPGYAWGLMGSGTMLGPLELFRDIGFDVRFRRAAEIDLAIRAAEKNVTFISVPAPIIKQFYSQTPDKSFLIMGKYQMMIIIKHWKLIIKRGLLLGAIHPYVRFFKKR